MHTPGHHHSTTIMCILRVIIFEDENPNMQPLVGSVDIDARVVIPYSRLPLGVVFLFVVWTHAIGFVVGLGRCCRKVGPSVDGLGFFKVDSFDIVVRFCLALLNN